MNEYKWGSKSWRQLLTVDPKLFMLFTVALRDSPVDMTVLEGYRAEHRQNGLYDIGHSNLRYPDSKHNVKPSKGIDVAPHPVNWDNIAQFELLGKHIKKVSDRLGIRIKWGGDWKTFKDYGHYELVDEV